MPSSGDTFDGNLNGLARGVPGPDGNNSARPGASQQPLARPGAPSGLSRQPTVDGGEIRLTDSRPGEATEGSLEQEHVRVNLPGTVETPGRGSVPVRVIDLGSTGGVIEHPDSIGTGEIGVLCLRLAGVNIRIRARFKYSHMTKIAEVYEPDGNRMRSRLEFLPLTQATEVVLKKFLAKPTSRGIR